MPSSPRPLALAYHGIDTVPLRQDTASLFVPAETLARQIRALRRWGYRLVTFGELARRAAAGEAQGCCALTFDDGFSDNLHTLLPILEREEVPATVFVVSSWFGITHPDAPWTRAMTEEEVRRLACGPIEIGSHSHSHRHLERLPYGEVLDDFRRSKATLEDVLQREVTSAAYPYGSANEETGRACRDAGFAAACRISGEGSWSDPMHIPREDIHNFTGPVGFRLKRYGWYEPIMRNPAGRALRGGGRRIRALRGG